jgi:NodT family efflux transporter outer membrane factor (OMF) lipoprotein
MIHPSLIAPRAATLGVALLVTGCAVSAPPGADAVSAQTPVPTQWQAPLPHNAKLTDLSQWWQQFNDPLLVRLIEAGQAVSPTLAQAQSRLSQAQATRTAAGAALLPGVDASANISRGFSEQTFSLATIGQANVKASWELDMFGANRATRDAAQERLAGAQASWHDARVSVAAEVANQYYSLRGCQLQLAVSRNDTNSRAETARLSELTLQAGFTAPASAALARASAAEARGRLAQQAAACDIDTKALVALTGLDEPTLRRELAAGASALPQDAAVNVATVPAQALLQRPDLYAAAREVTAASAETGAASARRYPQFSLSGSIGALVIRTEGTRETSGTWSFGPLGVSVPLFDGGRRAAEVDAAQARYDEAVAMYRGRVRQAVREVEEALVTLQSTGQRASDAALAVQGYRTSFDATEARYKGGLASLVELEDARRLLLAAETALVSLQRERVAAWISLYRAAGGGWAPEQMQAAAR